LGVPLLQKAGSLFPLISFLPNTKAEQKKGYRCHNSRGGNRGEKLDFRNEKLDLENLALIGKFVKKK
jgi:hypothetical protein